LSTSYVVIFITTMEK